MAKSSLVPNFALILSWNTNLCADASNNIVLLPAATRVTSSAKLEVPSTSRVSMLAVPSRCKSCHSNEDEPKSLAPSVEGTMSVSTLPVKLIVSLVALPKSTSPLAVRLPVIVAFSSTCKVSIVAVPSINRYWNSKVEEPKSLDPSVSGKMSPPTVTPEPTIRPPFAVTIPAAAILPVVTNTVATPEPPFSFDPSNVRFASSSSSPLDPAITTLLSVRSPIAAVSAARVSMFAVPSMNRSCHSHQQHQYFYFRLYQGLNYYR